MQDDKRDDARLAGEEFIAANRAATAEERAAHRARAFELVERLRRESGGRRRDAKVRG